MQNTSYRAPPLGQHFPSTFLGFFWKKALKSGPMADKGLPLSLTHYPSLAGKVLPVMVLTRCRCPDKPFLQKTVIVGKAATQSKPSVGTLSRPLWDNLDGSLALYMYPFRCSRGVWCADELPARRVWGGDSTTAAHWENFCAETENRQTCFFTTINSHRMQ